MNKLVAHITGDKQEYTLSENIKKYSLKDVGFIETNHGNFVYDRPIGDSPYDAHFKLKISISGEFDKLKMSVTDMSGLKDINVAKINNNDNMFELYQYILDDFIDRDILVKK